MLRTFLATLLLLSIADSVAAEVPRKQFTSAGAYLIVEVLDDDLIHVEAARGAPPALTQPIRTSPMVFRTDYTGPSRFTAQGDTLETPALRVQVNASTLCIRVEDKARASAFLTKLCPVDLGQPFKGLDVDPGTTTDVYGLGQQFTNPGSADGNWMSFGVRDSPGDLGNGFVGFEGGAVGNVQIPVMYAVGSGGLNYALFFDNVYKQTWHFRARPWTVRAFGDQVRFYVMAGRNLADLRADYMELTGRPPVPPRKAFGLWVSEFGYDNFREISRIKAGLRRDGFPVDGFVLDLNWFGGIVLNDASKSHMGRLDWDISANDGNPYSFANPTEEIGRFLADHVAISAIEESYVANTTATFKDLPASNGVYARTDGMCRKDQQATPVADVEGFWGKGRMIDWSDPAAGAFIHDQRRFPNLVKHGVTVHWTDLGEPESFRREGCYDGVETTAAGPKNEHSDVHNLYNLLWNKSIWDGYVSKSGQPDQFGRSNQRPLILTRSGAAGSQRFGAAMWSGDIPSNLRALATHANAQMQMSFSGIDFYGADIGGFRRETMPYNDKHGAYRGYEAELYTQWFAYGAWFDVPVRPHTDNEFVQVTPPYATAPNLVGDRASNLANLRQRYALIPYYYSLAYRAHLVGEPVIAPLVFYYQADPAVRRIGHEKLVGRDLLVGVVARHGEYERDVYLPKGKWVDYYSHEWVQSAGQTLSDVPLYRKGLLRLPAFARAGAIIPQMHVDASTKDAYGHRTASDVHDALIVKVIAGSEPSRFTLYEDDGATLGYDAQGRPVYRYRTTELRQQQISATRVMVTIDKSVDVGSGPLSNVPDARANLVKLVVDDAEASGVSLNDRALAEHASESAFQAANEGFWNAGRNLIFAKSEAMPTRDAVKQFRFELRVRQPSTSVHFVCDRGFTSPGESVYVAGSLPELGAFEPAKAIKLFPNIYYDYVDGVRPPPNHDGPGPSAPVWTAVVPELPASATFEWKCLRRREDGSGQVQWEPGANNTHRTLARGYSGQSVGSF